MISTLCFPKIDLSKYQIDLFTKQLASDIRFVRKENIVGNSGTYILFKSEGKLNSYIVRKDGLDLKEVNLIDNVNLLYNNGKINFKRDGTPNPKGQTIYIYNENIKKEITIVPVSGRVLLKEGKYET